MELETFLKQNVIRYFAALIMLIGFTELSGQEVVTMGGGEANGSGGSSSYTIGQTVYKTNEGSNGSTLLQGVQQPYEISIVTGITEAKGINLNISAFPNPTTHHLTIEVDKYETANLNYKVFDMNGRLMQTVKATGKQTKVKISHLLPAIYFVKVFDSKTEIKVFKIIKTN